jgi:hypothetical protein
MRHKHYMTILTLRRHTVKFTRPQRACLITVYLALILAAKLMPRRQVD